MIIKQFQIKAAGMIIAENHIMAGNAITQSSLQFAKYLVET